MTVIELGGPVPTWGEFGGNAMHHMADVVGRLRFDGGWFEPKTGTVGPLPVYSADDEAAADWALAGGTWEVVPAAAEGNKQVLYQSVKTAWSAQRAEALSPGQGFWIFFHTLGEAITLEFGGGWAVAFQDQQPVEAWWHGLPLAFGDSIRIKGHDHRLLVFNIGRVLLLKWAPDWDRGLAIPAPAPVVAAGIEYALDEAAPRISGDGRTVLGYRPLRWRENWSVELADTVPLFGRSTQGVIAGASGWNDSDQVVSVEVRDQNGTIWAPGKPAKSAFRWRVAVSVADFDEHPWKAAWLYRVDVRVAPTLTDSGTSGAAVLFDRITWRRGIDPGDHTLEAEVRTSADMAAWLQPGLRLDYWEDGVLYFTGVLEQPARQLDAVDNYVVRASAARRLYDGNAFNVADQNGLPLQTVLSNAIQAAGIPAGAIAVPSLPAVIQTGSEEALAPAGGDSAGRFLDYLLQQFAADYTWRGGPNFGYTVYPRDSGAVVATFGASSGSPVRIFRPARDEFDDSNYYDFVVVLGQDRFGNLLSAVAFDPAFGSAPPYVPRVLVIVDSGLQTPWIVAMACRLIFDQVSRKQARLSWEGDFVPAEPGDRVVVGGLGTYRLTEIEFEKRGIERRWRYAGVRVA